MHSATGNWDQWDQMKYSIFHPIEDIVDEPLGNRVVIGHFWIFPILHDLEAPASKNPLYNKAMINPFSMSKSSSW